MKDESFTRWFAVTIDQQRSRRGPDRVAALLSALERVLGDRARLTPERTAGDEVQLLTADPAAVVDLVRLVQCEGAWWTGIGLGAVETPLPSSTREARGDAYLAAREAVEAAKATPVGLVLCDGPGARGETVGGASYRDVDEAAAAVQRAETALWLLCELWQRRSTGGWQMVDLLEGGLGVGEAARELGISASAASQRHRRAGWEVERRGRQLAVDLLRAARDGQDRP
ncbi:hypothetical protein [Luteococcus peritonei]|uniref:DNA-binding protein n=1 Tax=Luteococcus peritonei TaxID=88874 RepID=A0ABW4RVQ4_9ACTN